MKQLSSITRGCQGVSALAIALAASLSFAGSAVAQTTIAFDVPAENTAQALNDFARQAKIQVLFPYDAASRSSAPAVRGSYGRDAALSLILANSNLEVATETAATITLRVGKPSQSAGAPAASADEPSTEVIVTGTHIRGRSPASPLHSVSRTDIEVSGYSQIGDLLRSLPENFSGGQNPGVLASASISNPNNNNASNASTVNLRGLGADATLVLLNGHRLSADSFFQGSDISGIPLAAVDRIEVVPDGSSALYGSDAVGGVTNIVLRRNYDGIEVSAHLGTTTRGGADEHTISVLSGRTFGAGYILANLEQSSQEGIRWRDRGITATGGGENTLWMPQDRTSLFIGGGYHFGPGVSITFDGLASDRDATGYACASGTSPLYIDETKTPAYSGALTLKINLPANWALTATGVQSNSQSKSYSSAPEISYAYSGRTSNDTHYLEASLDGTLLDLPSGALKLAFGMGNRQESYKNSSLNVHRDITYGFAEASVPLVRPSAERTGLEALEVDLSTRTESYSDFGRSANPKVGIRYVPVQGVALRATWGKSFKAPSFDQMYNPFQLYLFPAFVLGASGSGTGLYTAGANPDLKPETATSWTAGADLNPSFAPSSRFTVTYFSIAFDGRIVQPISSPTTSLSNPIFAPFVTLAPSAALQSKLFAAATMFNNFSGGTYDPANVVAFVDNRNTNASAQAIRGVDVGYRQEFEAGDGTIRTFANASWLHFTQRTIVTEPSVELTGTIFNPPKFKGRAGATWLRGGLTATAIVNYISSEGDTATAPSTKVGSWTTFDTNINYQFPAAGTLSGVKLALSAANLFDVAPPSTVTPLANNGPHFDNTNASILGRTISLTVSKSW